MSYTYNPIVSSEPEHVEARRKLATKMLELGYDHFEMATWVTTQDGSSGFDLSDIIRDEVEITCGTTACLAGTAAACGIVSFEEGYNSIGEHAVATALGINSGLFHLNSWPESTAAAMGRLGSEKDIFDSHYDLTVEQYAKKLEWAGAIAALIAQDLDATQDDIVASLMRNYDLTYDHGFKPYVWTTTETIKRWKTLRAVLADNDSEVILPKGFTFVADLGNSLGFPGLKYGWGYADTRGDQAADGDYHPEEGFDLYFEAFVHPNWVEEVEVTIEVPAH